VTESCACIVVDCDECYDESSSGISVAGTEHTCCECRRVIDLGEEYESAWGGYYKYDEDDNETLQNIDEYATCIDCVSIIDSFFCNGRLYHGMWEMLEGHLDEMVAYGPGIADSCITPLTDVARDMVCDMIEERWDDDEDEDE
jgi:hypothetical protein